MNGEGSSDATTGTIGSALLRGDEVLVKGSAKDPYVLRAHNDGQYFSCSCPAWRNQGATVDQRTCKHLTKELGAAYESARIGKAVLTAPNPDAPSKAPPVILAESWDGVTDPTGMLVSEKLDGVRAYWDGEKFLSRQGNVFYAPKVFVEGLPGTPLDGELWIGRGKFQRTVSIVRTGTGDRGWEDIRYVVFDAPQAAGGFEERIQFLHSQHASWNNARILILEHFICTGFADITERLDLLEQQGGEGLMLRAPGSAYTAGRTNDLLKVKRFKDAEARVVSLEAGRGRHKGRTGALMCELVDGKRFKIGTGLSDAERENPPAVGSIVTFRYQELTDGGIPRFPAFVRVRTDIDRLESGVGGTVSRPAAPKVVRPQTPTSETQKRDPSTSAAPKSQAPKPERETPKGENDSADDADGAADRYEFVEGGSAKFWEISIDGCDVTTRWGRIGTNGQTSTKAYKSEQVATATAAKQVAEKIDKGYEKV
jgi:DNA ligase 1